MSATAWRLYNKAKQKIGNGVIKLGTDTFKISLHTSASNADTDALILFPSVTNEVTGGGYAAKTLASVAWTVGTTTITYKYTSANPVFSAVGSSIVNIKYAIIRNSLSATSRNLLCRSTLTTAQFSLSSTNTLTIQMNSAGIFTLT